jgi:hypothetical protein
MVLLSGSSVPVCNASSKEPVFIMILCPVEHRASPKTPRAAENASSFNRTYTRPASMQALSGNQLFLGKALAKGMLVQTMSARQVAF